MKVRSIPGGKTFLNISRREVILPCAGGQNDDRTKNRQQPQFFNLDIGHDEFVVIADRPCFSILQTVAEYQSSFNLL